MSLLVKILYKQVSNSESFQRLLFQSTTAQAL